MTVLDASAALALIHNEPGGDVVAEEIAGTVHGAANLAEVVGKLVDVDIDVARLRELLSVSRAWCGIRLPAVMDRYRVLRDR